MSRRNRILFFAVTGSLLTGLWGAPLAIAGDDLCVHVNGVEIYQSGSARCDSNEDSVSVAIGENSEADTAGSFGDYDYEGSNNTAVAVGDGSWAWAGPGNSNTSTAVGEGSGADTGFENDNTATSVGSGSFAGAYEGGNTGTVVGDNSATIINPVEGDYGQGNTATVVGDENYADIANGYDNELAVVDQNASYTIVGEDGCVVVVVMGDVYGDESCLDM